MTKSVSSASSAPSAVQKLRVLRGCERVPFAGDFALNPDRRALMRAYFLVLSLVALPTLATAQGSPPQSAANQPYTMEYYYKTQWGHQQEFLQLFLKNHYPLLRKVVESGRMISVRIETPANHMTEDARWDYRVTIKFKNSTVA